jgi:hypothetical protein
MVKEFLPGEMEKLCQHLGDDLSEKHCEEIKKEVDNCPECKVVLNEIKGTVELYKKALPNREVPVEVIKRLKISLKLPK